MSALEKSAAALLDAKAAQTADFERLQAQAAGLSRDIATQTFTGKTLTRDINRLMEAREEARVDNEKLAQKWECSVLKGNALLGMLNANATRATTSSDQLHAEVAKIPVDVAKKTLDLLVAHNNASREAVTPEANVPSIFGVARTVMHVPRVSRLASLVTFTTADLATLMEAVETADASTATRKQRLLDLTEQLKATRDRVESSKAEAEAIAGTRNVIADQIETIQQPTCDLRATRDANVPLLDEEEQSAEAHRQQFEELQAQQTSVSTANADAESNLAALKDELPVLKDSHEELLSECAAAVAATTEQIKDIQQGIVETTASHATTRRTCEVSLCCHTLLSELSVTVGARHCEKIAEVAAHQESLNKITDQEGPLKSQLEAVKAARHQRRVQNSIAAAEAEETLMRSHLMGQRDDDLPYLRELFGLQHRHLQLLERLQAEQTSDWLRLNKVFAKDSAALQSKLAGAAKAKAKREAELAKKREAEEAKAAAKAKQEAIQKAKQEAAAVAAKKRQAAAAATSKKKHQQPAATSSGASQMLPPDPVPTAKPMLTAEALRNLPPPARGVSSDSVWSIFEAPPPPRTKGTTDNATPARKTIPAAKIIGNTPTTAPRNVAPPASQLFGGQQRQQQVQQPTPSPDPRPPTNTGGRRLMVPTANKANVVANITSRLQAVNPNGNPNGVAGAKPQSKKTLNFSQTKRMFLPDDEGEDLFSF